MKFSWDSREILVKMSSQFQALFISLISLIDEIERYKRYGIYTNGQSVCVVCIVAFQVFNERKKQYIQMYLESGREMAW